MDCGIISISSLPSGTSSYDLSEFLREAGVPAAILVLEPETRGLPRRTYLKLDDASRTHESIELLAKQAFAGRRLQISAVSPVESGLSAA